MQKNLIFSLQKRLLAIYVLIVSLFMSLVVRLGYLQIVDSMWLKNTAIEQWTRDLPIKASRGNIYDRNGVALATNQLSFDAREWRGLRSYRHKIGCLTNATLGRLALYCIKLRSICQQAAPI